MAKKYLLIASMSFFISLLFSISVMTASYAANTVKTSRITNNEATVYQYKLHMARGSLSFSEGYFDTAIKSFKKAIDLNPQSPEARSKYTQAILYKKLGIIMESTASG